MISHIEIKFKNINGINTLKKVIFGIDTFLKDMFFKSNWDRFLPIQEIISHFIIFKSTSLFAIKLSLHNQSCET
jgi:hypothetical protein